VTEENTSQKSVSGTPIIICQRGANPDSKQPSRLQRVLEGFGRKVKVIPDGSIQLDPLSVLWIQNNAVWFPTVFRQLASCPPGTRPLTVHWVTEPLPPPHAAGLPRPRLHLKEIAKILLRDARITDVYSNAAKLRSLTKNGLIDLLVVTTLSRQKYLEEHGIKAHFVPLGYARKTSGHDLGLERFRDVTFLGAIVPRRRKLLKKLRGAGIQIEQMGSWSDPDCWGESRTRILNQTKIFLNISRFPGDLAGARMILGMANKCLVVSEPLYEPGPYVPGKHFVACSIEEMADKIRYYLEHPEERQRIIDAGHRLVTETVTYERSVKKILTLVDERVRHRAQSSANAT
jgi:glycosyltransferase involved in cell wall biosynthesis